MPLRLRFANADPPPDAAELVSCTPAPDTLAPDDVEHEVGPIDRGPELIAKLEPILDEMIGDGLVTMEKVKVVRYGK